MSWLRWKIGTASDRRWREIAAAAGDGASPGHCIAVWACLLEFAAQTQPRGECAGFDCAGAADALGCETDLVQRVMDAFREKNLVVEGRCAAWTKPNKGESTSAERSRKYRYRSRHGCDTTVTPNASRNGNTVTDLRHGGDTTVTPNASRNGNTVTDLRHGAIGKSSSSFFSFSSSLKPTSTQIPIASSAARERASGEKLSTEAIWQMLESIGIRSGMFGRFGSGSMLTHWVSRGMTAADLNTAIERARRARERQNDHSPINLRFLGCFVEDVLGGIPERAGGESWLQRGDALGRKFVEEHS